MRHENTIVYGKCIELMETARSAIVQFPRGYGFLTKQLRESTASVARNFAEGYYYDSTRQRRRYFGYAIQSARESAASFDTARAFKACRPETVARGKSLALEIIKMLSKWSGRPPPSILNACVLNPES